MQGCGSAATTPTNPDQRSPISELPPTSELQKSVILAGPPTCQVENERQKPSTPSKEEVESNEKNIVPVSKLGQIVFKLRLVFLSYSLDIDKILLIRIS